MVSGAGHDSLTSGLKWGLLVDYRAAGLNGMSSIYEINPP